MWITSDDFFSLSEIDDFSCPLISWFLLYSTPCWLDHPIRRLIPFLTACLIIGALIKNIVSFDNVRIIFSLSLRFPYIVASSTQLSVANTWHRTSVKYIRGYLTCISFLNNYQIVKDNYWRSNYVNELLKDSLVFLEYFKNYVFLLSSCYRLVKSL